jgi:hypothetical protein
LSTAPIAFGVISNTVLPFASPPLAAAKAVPSKEHFSVPLYEIFNA